MREPGTIESFIKEARTFLDEIKNKQQVAGDNVLFYTSNSDELYDIHVYSDAPLLKVRVTLTFDTATDRALINSFPVFSVNNPDVMANAQTPTSSVPQIQVFQDDIAPYDHIYYDTDIYIRNNSFDTVPVNYDVYIKLFFTGTDHGTWVWELIP